MLVPARSAAPVDIAIISFRIGNPSPSQQTSLVLVRARIHPGFLKMPPVDPARRLQIAENQARRAPPGRPAVTILFLDIFQQDGVCVRPDRVGIEDADAEVLPRRPTRLAE